MPAQILESTCVAVLDGHKPNAPEMQSQQPLRQDYRMPRDVIEVGVEQPQISFQDEFQLAIRMQNVRRRDDEPTARFQDIPSLFQQGDGIVEVLNQLHGDDSGVRAPYRFSKASRNVSLYYAASGNTFSIDRRGLEAEVAHSHGQRPRTSAKVKYVTVPRGKALNEFRRPLMDARSSMNRAALVRAARFCSMFSVNHREDSNPGPVSR